MLQRGRFKRASEQVSLAFAPILARLLLTFVELGHQLAQVALPAIFYHCRSNVSTGPVSMISDLALAADPSQFQEWQTRN